MLMIIMILMRKIFAAISIFIVSFFLISATPATAKVITSEEGDIIVAKGEVINDDLFIGGQGVVINGTVNGDVFVGAQTVRIGGIINGNLHIGAQTINLGGTVKGNIYLGGQDVTITSLNLGGSLISGSQSLNLDNTSTIGGSVISGSANTNINSQIKRNAILGAATLTIGENTRIGKDLSYAASSEAGMINISEKAKIGGQIHKVDTSSSQKDIEKVRSESKSFFAGAKIATSIISYLGALLVGLLTFKLFGNFLSNSTNKVTNSFWKSLGIGFLVMIASLPGIIILLITIIGIPVAGLSILLLILYSCLAKIVVGNALGNLVATKLKWKMGGFGAFAFGLLLIYLLKIIPVAGGILGMVVLWTGLGAITLNIFSKKE